MIMFGVVKRVQHILVIDELKSNLIQLAVLNTTINVSYQDGNSIGYRNTNANAVDITALQGYPTGKNVLAIIPVGYEAIISTTFSIDSDKKLNATSKVSGNRGCYIYILYTD